MRWLFVVTVLAACTKSESQGLPAADNWNADQAAKVDPKTAKTAPKTGFHGGSTPGGDPSNPHAGMDVDPSNPHGGIDPSNPHAGMDPNNPHGGMDPNGGMQQGPSNGPMIEKTPPRTLEKLPDGKYALGPFALALPDGWASKPVTSSMRVADLTFGDGEMIVYYFGTSGAGSIDDNLDRWLGQMVQPDGKNARDIAKIEKTKVNNLDATIMTVTGSYSDGGMMGGAPVNIADAEMLAAIVASPQGPYYFKGFGPKKTIEANIAKFRAMLSAMKVR